MSAPNGQPLEETFARAARNAQRLHLFFISATLVYVGAAFALKMFAFMPPDSGFIWDSEDSMSFLLAFVFMAVAIGLAGMVTFVLAPSRLRVSVEERDAEEILAEIIQRSIAVIAISERGFCVPPTPCTHLDTPRQEARISGWLDFTVRHFSS